MNKINWHSIALENIFTETKSKKEGLTGLESSERLKKFGRNAFPQQKSYSKIRLFLNQFNSPLIQSLTITDWIVIFNISFIETILIELFKKKIFLKQNYRL